MTNFKIWYGIMLPPIEEQLNKQGYTLGKDAERVENLRQSVLSCWLNGLATDAQSDSMMKKLNKRVQESAFIMENNNETDKES